MLLHRLDVPMEAYAKEFWATVLLHWLSGSSTILISATVPLHRLLDCYGASALAFLAAIKMFVSYGASALAAFLSLFRALPSRNSHLCLLLKSAVHLDIKAMVLATYWILGRVGRIAESGKLVRRRLEI